VGLLCATVSRMRALGLELAFLDAASSSPRSSPCPFLRRRDTQPSASFSFTARVASASWASPPGEVLEVLLAEGFVKHLQRPNLGGLLIERWCR
jgi:hypothetical protein